MVEFTLTAGTVPPPGTDAAQLTDPVPEPPVPWSGIDCVLVSPAVPSVGMTTLRVTVLEPTVSVQLTVVRCAVAPLVTVAIGFAMAR